MTWALVDDHANEHPKLLAAGAEAAWLWVCGLMYCRRQRGGRGFIPAPMLGMLYPFKAPKKLAARLVEVGLWEVTEGGYLVHQYAEWCDQGRRSAESSSRGDRRNRRKGEDPDERRGDCPDQIRTMSGRETGGLSGPDPDSPDPYRSDPIRSVPEAAAAAAGDPPDGEGDEPTPPAVVVHPSKVPCPPASEILTPAQRATLETAMIPGWAIDATLGSFAARASADPADLRPLIAWRKCAARAVSGDWNDPRRRPRQAEPGGGSPIPLRGGAVQREGESFVAKWRERERERQAAQVASGGEP